MNTDILDTQGPLLYKATRDDGMVYYGVTARTISKRYVKNTKSHYFSCAYRKAPERFTWEVVTYDTIEEAYDMERMLVQQDIVDSPKYFNMSLGGRYSGYCQPHTRLKISKANKGRKLSKEHKILISERQLGRPVPEETKAKIAKTMKERAVDPSIRAAYARSFRPQGYPDVVDPEGNKHEVGDNLKSFTTLHNLGHANMSRMINKGRGTCQGWSLYKEGDNG
jgi:hypothetical protein